MSSSFGASLSCRDRKAKNNRGNPGLYYTIGKHREKMRKKKLPFWGDVVSSSSDVVSSSSIATEHRIFQVEMRRSTP